MSRIDRASVANKQQCWRVLFRYAGGANAAKGTFPNAAQRSYAQDVSLIWPAWEVRLDDVTGHKVEPALYREAMSRLVAAVHVITTRSDDGRAGFTATAVVSVSDSPPTLLVCLNRRVRSAPAFRKSGIFVVNMLNGDQQKVADSFGGRLDLSGERRFSVGHWHEGRLGAPCLTNALASFECTLMEARTIATHDVLVGRVEAITLGPNVPGLAYLGRDYRVL